MRCAVRRAWLAGIGAILSIIVGCTDAAGVLPESPNTNYTPSDPVKSADLVDLQAQIIGMKQPGHWVWFAFGRAPLETNVSFDNGGGIHDGRVAATAGAAFLKGYQLNGIIPG